MSGLKNFYGCIAKAVPTTGKLIYDHPHINMDGMINVYFTDEQLEQIKATLPKICFKFFTENLSCTVKKMQAHIEKEEKDEDYFNPDMNNILHTLESKSWQWYLLLIDGVCKICPAFAEYVKDVKADAVEQKKIYDGLNSDMKFRFDYKLTDAEKRIYDNYALQHLMELAMPVPKDKCWLRKVAIKEVLARLK